MLCAGDEGLSFCARGKTILNRKIAPGFQSFPESLFPASGDSNRSEWKLSALLKTDSIMNPALL
jgi:hypothetical protein